MEKINLFVDFDNTLVNTAEVAVEYFNKRFNKNEDFHKLHKYNFKDLFPELTDRDLDNFFENEWMFRHCKFNEDCNSYFDRVKSKVNIWVVSKCSENNKKLKIQWILDHAPFVDIFYCAGHKGTDKSKVDMTGGICIDDHIDCLRSCNAKIKILYTAGLKGDWNSYDNTDEIYEVGSWKDIFKIIDFYIENGGVI